MAKRDTRRPSVATLAALIASLLLLASLVAAAPSGACRDQCYRAKSRNYKRCRVIPPTDRAGRNGCFKRADSALRRCLSRCRKGK